MPFYTAGDLIAGEYRVVRQLGAGGMAVVYLCTDIGLDSHVVVKVLSDQLMGIPEARERFLQEARTMYRLRHPGIMPVQRVVHHERLAAMVMPYFEGQTLADLMDAVPPGQRAVPEAEALRIFGDLLSAVRFAHESSPSVIHRDLKPDNIYLAGRGARPRVLLMDFGIAKVLQESAVRTQTGSRMGTVAYMAPEQIQASKSVGVAADIWSLGVVLYELLCGRRPFESDSDLLLAGVVVAAQVPEAPLRGVGEELRGVIRRCLRKEAGARYASVAGLERAVAEVGRGAVEARAREAARVREEARERARREAARNREAAWDGTEAPGFAHRWRPVLLGGLALVLALGAVVSWLALRPGGRPRSVESPRPAAETPTPKPARSPPPAVPAPAPGPPGIEWVRLPGGTFRMGSTSGDSDEKPVRQVWLGAFSLMKSEITVAMWRSCVAAGKCSAPNTGGSCTWGKSGVDDHPVNCIDLTQARGFCAWAGGRLPSESEWEYAASGGEGRKYPWGEAEATCDRAVMDDGGGNGCGRGDTSRPACSKPKGNSKHGICDLAGNVWEWVEDRYHDSYTGAPQDGTAWTQGSDSCRVIRGGSWLNPAANLRAAFRNRYDPGRRSGNLGGRCARSG